jgi:phosphonate transport system ATP-binding protein
VLGFLQRVCKEKGISVICNLHQVEYALEFGERIVGLSGGNIIFDDTPDKLTLEMIHRIYPGLEDPGMERLLRGDRRPKSQSVTPLTRVATA